MKNWFKLFDRYSIKTPSGERIFYKCKYCGEQPDEISERVIYIVGHRPHYWMLSFKCPCGCKETISLNILKGANPRWRFVVRWRRITIYPSIWRKVGCKSHFHIRRGRVRWSYV